MVRSSQVSGVGEEPLQATRYLRGNGSHPRHGPGASLVRVLPKPSRAPILPPCAESSSDRSDIANRFPRVGELAPSNPLFLKISNLYNMRAGRKEDRARYIAQKSEIVETTHGFA